MRHSLRGTGVICASLLLTGLSAAPAVAACDLATLTVPSLSISQPAPVRFATDITKRAQARVGDDPEFRMKLRRATPGLSGFNNEPRYELAAYALQRLIFGEGRDVVPPTTLRTMPLATFHSFDDQARETFPKTGVVFYVAQCWLEGAKPHDEVIDPARFASDAAYARAISDVNVLTYLIEHKDSNRGNVMLTQNDGVTRAWAIDNGVAFASDESDRGTFWRQLRVPAIHPSLAARLRALTLSELETRLGVVAEYRWSEGTWVPQELGANTRPTVGVRRSGDALQLGLTRKEIRAVHSRLRRLLERIDRGDVRLLADAS